MAALNAARPAFRPYTKQTSARGFQFGFRLGETNFIDVGEDYFHARTNTSFGYRSSDAAGGSSNHRNFAFKLFHLRVTVQRFGGASDGRADSGD